MQTSEGMGSKVAVTFSEGAPHKAQAYAEAVLGVGLDPVLNPDSMDGIDGLLLTGGVDVDPRFYGEVPHAETEEPDLPRDERELRLLEEALANGIPVLGICRGLQLFNVAQGGSLVQHLERSLGHEVRESDASLDAHTVNVLPDTQLAAACGEGPRPVNSRHHQAIKELGQGLKISARAPDGIVEGIELPDQRFAVAVQWHAEDRFHTDKKDRKLFEAFAEAIHNR